MEIFGHNNCETLFVKLTYPQCVPIIFVMSNPHDKSLGQKHDMNPPNGSSQLETGVGNPPNRPRARRADATNDNVVVVSQVNEMVTGVTNRGLGSSAMRGGRRLRRQREEPDPPVEVAQAARVLRRRMNPKMPKLPRPCSACSLKFYCWRELFAHMRTHPEKESRCMREIFPPLESPAGGEAGDHGSGVDGWELASTSLHMLPMANKGHGDRNAAFSMEGSRGRDVAAVVGRGVGTSGSVARASPPNRGSGFDFDLNKPPPKEENDDDDDSLDLQKLPQEAEEGGGR